MTCYNFCHPGNVAGSVYISGTTCFDGVGAFYLNNGDCICIDIDEPYQTCDNPVLAPGCQCEGDECCFQESGSTTWYVSTAISELQWITDDKFYVGGSRANAFNGQALGTGGGLIPKCGGYTGATALNLRCLVPFRGVTESYQIFPLPTGKWMVRSGVNISRLNADFTTDNTYNSVYILGGNSDGMDGMYITPSGEAYITGIFGSGVRDCSGVTSTFNTNIYKINANGGVNTAYSGITFLGPRYSQEQEGQIATETDPLTNTALIVGVSAFTGNSLYSPIMKLLPNGSPDPTFDNSLFRGLSGASRTQIYGSYIQRDGKYLVYGSFTNLSGTGRNYMVRIFPNGTLDTTFTSPNDPTVIQAVNDAEQDIYQNYHVVGSRGGPGYYYNSYTKNGTFRFSIRTNTPPSGFFGRAVACNECEVIIGGSNTFYSGSTPYNAFLKFDLNGNLNMCQYDCFSGTGFNGLVDSLIVDNQNTNRVYACGQFTTMNGVNRENVTRFYADGQIDFTFDSGTGFGVSEQALCISQFSNGKIIVGGNFTSYRGTSRNRLVRINTDGTLDNTFAIGTGFNNSVNSVLILPDDSVVVGGQFTTYSGQSVGRIVKLSSTGQLIWSSSAITNGVVGTITQNADGTLYVSGSFTAVGGGTRNRLVQLNADGTYTSSLPFNASGVGPNAGVNKHIVQSNGQLMIAGDFTAYNGTTIGRGIARINPNGTRDTSFVTGTGFSNYQYDVIQQGSKYICVGFSFAYSGISCNQVTRLNNNGSFDATWFSGDFTSPTTEDSIQHLLQLPTGFIFVAGFFNSYASNLTDNIVKLNQDGIYFDCDPVPVTPTPTVTPTMTRTPTMTPTRTATPSVTPSITTSQTQTPSATPTITPTIDLSPTQTPSQTETPSATPTITQTATPSQTATQTATPSITPSPTATSGVTGCLCYRLLNETGSPIDYQWDDCVLGASTGTLNGGQSVQVCAVDLPVIDPGGTITPCTSVTNCNETADCTGCS